MRNAHILLIGLRGVANETAKNLVLAGIGALTVVDTENVTEADLAAQFFVQEKDIGKNRAEAALPEIQALNPRVKLQASNVDVKSQSEEWFSQFQVVIATDQTKETLVRGYCSAAWTGKAADLLLVASGFKMSQSWKAVLRGWFLWSLRLRIRGLDQTRLPH